MCAAADELDVSTRELEAAVIGQSSVRALVRVLKAPEGCGHPCAAGVVDAGAGGSGGPPDVAEEETSMCAAADELDVSTRELEAAVLRAEGDWAAALQVRGRRGVPWSAVRCR